MQIQIINRIDREFGMVPRALWSMELPFTAKGLAAYLLCLRDGAAPYVAEIEAATGLGRDARRKAFALLERAGVIQWKIERNARGQVVSKSLCVDAMACLAPENQAGGQNYHAPEKPAGGLGVPTGTDSRLSTDAGLGDPKEKQKKKERAAAARRSVRQPTARTAASRQPLDSGGATPSRVVDGRREYRGPDGAWYRRPSDAADAAAFDRWISTGQRGAIAKKGARA